MFGTFHSAKVLAAKMFLVKPFGEDPFVFTEIILSLLLIDYFFSQRFLSFKVFTYLILCRTGIRKPYLCLRLYLLFCLKPSLVPFIGILAHRFQLDVARNVVLWVCFLQNMFTRWKTSVFNVLRIALDGFLVLLSIKAGVDHYPGILVILALYFNLVQLMISC